MFISSENEQISLASVNVKEPLKSFPMESNPDSPDGFPPLSDLSDSPPLPTVYTDVNVVPEHENNQLQLSISNLEEEIAELKIKQRFWNEKRRETFNKILNIKGSIRVFCRVRPFLLTEKKRIYEPVSTELEKIGVMTAGTRKEFEFDKVFSQQVSQENVFVEVEPILRSALDGHNVCVLAYGQTGTGKTFTMDGTIEQPGIVPRALEKLFHQVSLESTSITFSMSMLEVYMGSLRDLLAPRPARRSYQAITRCNLNIQTDQKGTVEVENLTEVQIPDYAKARWWYSRGRRARSTSWTNVNESSSRSHCLTRIIIYRNGGTSDSKTEVSKLWLVDLGGSERLLKTGASGLTLDEGRAINLSLSALGDVIAALRRKRGHVPYRNSKLTQILKDSLGDSSKVLMIVHVSPCEEDVGETIYSLCFAKRARAVESIKEPSEDLKKQKEKRVQELEEVMREADEESQKIKYQIQKADLLLNEKKKLNSENGQNVEEEEDSDISPKEDLKEIVDTPRISEKAIRRNIPRFMTSTVASRQRQSVSEREIVGRARISRSATKSSLSFLAARSSIQLTASQSISYSDLHFKALLINSSRTKQSGEIDVVDVESPKCNVSKKNSLSQSKMVSTSDSNTRARLCRHRRRMSDLI